MSKCSLFVKFTASPGRRDDLLAALRKMLPVVADEDGTEIYCFNTDRGDENVLWMFELYRDDEALGVHGGSDAMKNLMGDLSGLVSEAPLMVFCTPTDAKGFDT